MLNIKWFHPIQGKVKEHLAKWYIASEMQFQDVTKDRVYEVHLVKNDKDVISVLLVVLHKSTNGFQTFIRN